ncbi:MAG: portal protein, partial [Solimonas sp.]
DQVDRRLLNCLRRRKGVYADADLAEFRAQGCVNLIFMPLSATKCRAAAAWIRDILMPTADRAWSLTPTTLPDLPAEYRMRLVAQAAQQAKQGMVEAGQAMNLDEFRQWTQELSEKLEAQVRRGVAKEADVRAGRMTERISDLMDEGAYDTALEEFIEDFTAYPAAILKGPYTRRTRRLEWLGGWTPAVTTGNGLAWKRVSPFDCYPAPNARSPQEREFIERLRLTETELYNMIGVPGNSEWDIRQVLQGHKGGKLRHWIWTDTERNKLEGDTAYDWLTRDDLIDGLHYWGAVPGRVLLEWGYDAVEVDDPDRPYEVDAILIGGNAVRCVINDDPLGQRPYHKACYEAVPGAFWGRAIPEMCEPHEDVCNASARALVNNLGIASGPQVYMEVDRLADGEAITQMHPWKIWQFKSDPNASQRAPIGFFQPGSNAQELLAVFENFERRADDATGIPRYSYGNERVGGAGSTASGLSMLLNAAAKGLRRGITNIDSNVIAPTVYQTFVWAMLYVDDPSIKGDCTVVPRGAAALLIKDQAQQRRQEALAATANPVDLQIIGRRGRAELLRQYFDGLELRVGDIVPSDEELEAQERTAQQQQAAQQEAAQQQALQQAAAKDASPQAQEDAGGPPAGAEGPAPKDLLAAQIEQARLASRERINERDNATRFVIAGMKHGNAGYPAGAGDRPLVL